MTKLEIYNWLFDELIDGVKKDGVQWASKDCRFYIPYGSREIRIYPPDNMNCTFVKNKWINYYLIVEHLRGELGLPKQKDIPLTFGYD